MNTFDVINDGNINFCSIRRWELSRSSQEGYFALNYMLVEFNGIIIVFHRDLLITIPYYTHHVIKSSTFIHFAESSLVENLLIHCC